MKITYTLLLLALCSSPAAESQCTEKYERITRLMSLARAHRSRIDFSTVERLVNTSENLGRTCLPKLFKPNDFLAIAFVESNFDPYAVGKAGEMGTWQVLEWRHFMRKVKGTNPFDVETNGKMFCAELREKNSHHHTYKKTIVSYNGLGAKGLRYYKKVLKAKTILVSL